MPKTQPERRLSPSNDGLEVRLVTLSGIEVRAPQGDGPIGFKGHAAVFDTRVRIGGRWGWFEEIDPRAFDSALERPDDVRMLKNHNTDLVLARTAADNLRLDTDNIGLFVDADMTPTTYAKDLALSLNTGDVSQMSFGFRVLKDEWSTINAGEDDEAELRVIQDVELWEVSPVTFPAYADTDASLRAREADLICRSLGLDTPEERHRVVAALAETDPNPDLAAALRAAATRLTERAASLGSTPEPQDDPQPASAVRSMTDVRRRHNLRAQQLGISA